MAVLSDAAIKLLFQTGDLPTEADFANFIDSKINVLDFDNELNGLIPFAETKNLVEERKINQGFQMAASGAVDPRPEYWHTDFIPVDPSLPYVSSTSVRFHAYFNAAKNNISGGSNNNVVAGTVFNPPANAAFIVLSIFASDFGLDRIQFEQNNVITDYQSGAKKIAPEVAEDTLDGLYRKDSTVQPFGLSETDWATPTSNLFDYTAATIGDLPASGVPRFTGTSALKAFSDFIPVVPGQVLYANQILRFFTYYNAAKGVRSSDGTNDATQIGTPITVPANCFFIRVTWNNKDIIDSAILAVTDSVPAFEPFGFTTNLLTSLKERSVWASYRMTSYGDSVVSQNAWQPYVATSLGVSNSQVGVGGRRISGAAADAMHQDAAISALPVDGEKELIVVHASTNDWAQSVALGAEDSTDTADFYGALNVMIGKLLTRFVLGRVVFVAPAYAEHQIGRSGWPDQITNAAGLKLIDYGDAIAKRCQLNGIPVAKANELSGINTNNVNTFYIDDGARLHPNAEGGKRIAAVVIGLLESIKPIA